MFEIVLFYQALWAQTTDSGSGAIAGGALAAAAVLAAIGFALFKYSIRLPIGPFFGATSALLAVLAIVFAGHGVAALQESGVIGTTPLAFDAIPVLGVYPSGESIGLQITALAAVIVSFLAARRMAVRTAAS